MQTLIATSISSIVSLMIGFLVSKIKNMTKEDTDMKDAVKSMLRSEITSYYYLCIGRNYIYRWEKENVIYLHSSYKKLHGNSYVDEIVKEMEKLEVKTQIVKE